MQSLKLADDLFPKLSDRSKRGTIRTGKRDIAPGEMLLEAASGATLSHLVDVRRVSYTTAAQLTPEDAALDGYASVSELFAALRQFYPSITGSDLVTVIEFR